MRVRDRLQPIPVAVLGPEGNERIRLGVGGQLELADARADDDIVETALTRHLACRRLAALEEIVDREGTVLVAMVAGGDDAVRRVAEDGRTQPHDRHYPAGRKR